MGAPHIHARGDRMRGEAGPAVEAALELHAGAGIPIGDVDLAVRSYARQVSQAEPEAERIRPCVAHTVGADHAEVVGDVESGGIGDTRRGSDGHPAFVDPASNIGHHARGKLGLIGIEPGNV